MYRVLILEPSIEKYGVLEILKKEGFEIVKSPYPTPVKEKDLLKIIKGVDAVIAGNDELTANVLEAADRLKVIARYGAGYEAVDLEAAAREKIVVALAPNQEAVADFTFGLLLCLARRICEANALTKSYPKSGEWEKLSGTEVWGKTLGVIGVGRIGQTVIKRARGFEMRILAYDVHQDDRIAQGFGFEYTTLERVLQESDFVTLHCALNDTTRGLLNKDRLALMKPSAYLINTARAPVVDEEALYEALKNKRIAGAAIDPYAQMPPPRDFPLFLLDNVITTPWIASNTPETQRSGALTCVQNILAVFKGKKPLYVVDLPA